MRSIFSAESFDAGFRVPMTSAAWVGFVLATLLFAVKASAGNESSPLISFEAQEALRSRLVSRVVLVEVQPSAGPYEDPALVPLKFGQGIPVMFENRAVILTSWFLVTGASSGTSAGTSPIHVMTADLKNRTAVSLVEELPDAGLAILSLPDSIRDATGGTPATPGKLVGPDYTKTLFCVTPALPGTYVMTSTAVTDVAGPPLERLFMAPGVLGRGTVLFDADGVPVAISARESYSGNGFTIVGRLERPAPDEPVITTDSDENKKQ